MNWEITGVELVRGLISQHVTLQMWKLLTQIAIMIDIRRYEAIWHNLNVLFKTI